MTPTHGPADEVLHDALARFGVVDAKVTPIVPGGQVNEHWRIDGRAAPLVLRRYNVLRTAAAAAYEHDVLKRLGDGGEWPVAAPIAAANGATIVEADGRLYALFPFLEGAAGPAHSLPHLRIKGRLLARLHDALAALRVTEQRPTVGKLWELDVNVHGSGYATFNDALAAFGRKHRELASGIRAQRYRSLRELSRLRYGEQPDTLIHGDFRSGNLLFAGGALSGALDFDLVHLDARITDIAWSVLSDCAEPPADTALDPAAAAAFLGGYAEHSPLTGAEARLIVPLIRAHNLAILASHLRSGSEIGDDPQLLYRVERRVRERLPQLDARASAIEEMALRVGTGQAAG